LETLIGGVQKLTVTALAGMLVVVVLLSTAHLGVLIAQEIWKPPRVLIPVQGVVTENSVRAENAEVPSIHEILVVSR
jgi:hypothetical protein